MANLQNQNSIRDEDDPPRDVISFTEAAARLSTKYGTTEYELAAWMMFNSHALGSWIVTSRNKDQIRGRHFSEHDLRVRDPQRPEIQPSLPGTAAHATSMIKALDVHLSAAQVDSFVVANDDRFLDFEAVHKLISSRVRDKGKAAEIIRTWQDVHNKVRNLEHAPDKVGAFIPFTGYAEKIEDGIVMRIPMESFLDRQLATRSPNKGPLDGNERDETQAAEYIAAWWDQSLDATFWWESPSVTPLQAALLLCRHNPNSENENDGRTTTTDETDPTDFVRLLNAFEALERATPAIRTLQAWLDFSTTKGLKTHTWIDEWQSATRGNIDGTGDLQSGDSHPAASNTPLKPVSRQKAQEEAIFASLIKMEFDAKKIPLVKNSQPGAKAKVWDDVKAATDVFSSRSVFLSAWKRMRANKDLCDATE